MIQLKVVTFLHVVRVGNYEGKSFYAKRATTPSISPGGSFDIFLYEGGIIELIDNKMPEKPVGFSSIFNAVHFEPMPGHEEGLRSYGKKANNDTSLQTGVRTRKAKTAYKQEEEAPSEEAPKRKADKDKI